MRRREPALVGLQHVHPGQGVAVEGLDPQPDLSVEAVVGALPAVQAALVVGGDVVEPDEDLLTGRLDQGR